MKATFNETPSIESVANGRSPAIRRYVRIAAILAIACILPFAISGYLVSQFSQVLIYAIAMLGLNILTGFNGQISLGHGAFYGIGAYTTAILLDKSPIPYWATVPIAGVICLGAGFLFGLPALRFEGLYLALATLALAVATPQILKFKSFEYWTGGVQGIQVDPPAAPFGLPLNTDRWTYYFCLIWTIALLILARNLLRGRTGRAIIAIRDHPLAAAAMGVDTALYKSLTFGVSAMYTGIAGALGALLSAYVSPDSFPVFLSIKFLVGSVVGGIRSISGAFIGALFLEFTPNFADQISTAAPDAIFGIILIALMYLMPTGAVGVFDFIGLKDVLGDKFDKMVVTASYETTDPTVDSQITSLQAAGANVLLVAATPKFAAQAIRKVHDMDWKPLFFMSYVSISVGAVIKPAGPENAIGMITAGYVKDPNDPAWKNDAGMNEWRDFMAKYMPGADTSDVFYASAYAMSKAMLQVLKQCEGDFTRENIMKQALSLHDLELPTLLPGIKVNTSPTNHRPIRQMQLEKFDGATWVRFGIPAAVTDQPSPVLSPLCAESQHSSQAKNAFQLKG